MERWVIYAIISMFFAGFTSVIAKQGLVGISAEIMASGRRMMKVVLFVIIFLIIYLSWLLFRRWF